MATMDVTQLAALTGENEKFLGVLCWQSIGDQSIPAADLTRITEATIGKDYVPSPINASDAFRRATTLVEQKGIGMGNGRKINMLVRDVSPKGEPRIVRQFVRELVDSNNERLEYVPFAQVECENGQWKCTPLISVLAEEEQRMTVQAELAYQHELTHHNSRIIRDQAARVLGHARAISVRPSGGVYFVPRSHVADIENLKQFFLELHPYHTNGTRARAWTVPVINTEEQRALVQESLEVLVAQESNTLIADISDALHPEVGPPTVTTRKVSGFLSRLDAVREIVKAYTEDLALKSEKLTTALQLAGAGIVQLTDHLAAHAQTA